MTPENGKLSYERLLSRHNFLRSKTTTPCGRFFKDGWHKQHQYHNKCLKTKESLNTLLIRDSIIYGLGRYQEVWNNFFGTSAINCGIRGDSVENTLWRAENLAILRNTKEVVILCGKITSTKVHQKK